MCQVKNDEVCPYCGESIAEEEITIVPDFCDYCVNNNVCPTCGICPTCGKRTWEYYPWYPPPQTTPVVPTWPTGPITWTTDTVRGDNGE
jgi:hypothetical protein